MKLFMLLLFMILVMFEAVCWMFPFRCCKFELRLSLSCSDVVGPFWVF